MAEQIFLDSRSPVPLYYQLKEILSAKIANGEWSYGQLIPTENELIQHYKVSRTTVREAVIALVNEGKLEKKQGRGTTVCKPKIVEVLGRLTGFSERMQDLGYVPGARFIKAHNMAAPDPVKEKLGTGHEQVFYMKRVRLADKEPIAVEETYWPLSIGELFRDEALSTAAFYTILENRGIGLRDADEVISASNAGKQDAALLHIAEGDPLLRIERVAYSTAGVPIQYSVHHYRSDRYVYRVHLQR